MTTTVAADMFITIGLQWNSFVQLAPTLTPRIRAEVSLKGLDLTVATFFVTVPIFKAMSAALIVPQLSPILEIYWLRKSFISV